MKELYRLALKENRQIKEDLILLMAIAWDLASLVRESDRGSSRPREIYFLLGSLAEKHGLEYNRENKCYEKKGEV